MEGGVRDGEAQPNRERRRAVLALQCPAVGVRQLSVIEDEAELAWELFLSLHAVRERLARLEAKLGVRTAGDAVAWALRGSL